MLTLSPETEALIRARMSLTGKSPDEILRDALAPVSSTVSPGNRVEVLLTEQELIARMEELSRRSAARSSKDSRSIDDIIDYDEFGLPR